MDHRRYLVPMITLATVVLLMQAFTYTSFAATLSLGQLHFDKIQHFGAGVSCGILGCYIVSFRADKENNHWIVFSAFASALIIGVLWEVCEHLWPELNGGPHEYLSFDTKLDVFFDVTGGVIASLFYWTKKA